MLEYFPLHNHRYLLVYSRASLATLISLSHWLLIYFTILFSRLHNRSANLQRIVEPKQFVRPKRKGRCLLQEIPKHQQRKDYMWLGYMPGNKPYLSYYTYVKSAECNGTRCHVKVATNESNYRGILDCTQTEADRARCTCHRVGHTPGNSNDAPFLPYH